MKSYLLFIVLTILFISCGGKKEKSVKENQLSSPKTAIKRKSTKVTVTSEIRLGDSLEININPKAKDVVIDSVLVHELGEKTVFTRKNFKYLPKVRAVGVKRLKLEVFSSKGKDNHVIKPKVFASKSPVQMTYSVQNTYPHDKQDYTQGLLIHDGFLYESTGVRGKSALIKKELKTGKTIIRKANDAADFGEGLVLYSNHFYQLTWKNKKGYVYDMSFNQVMSFNYNTEGWGFESVDNELVMTDGSNKLYFIEPKNLSVIRELEVYDDKQPIYQLNELEYINELLYANIYTTNKIVAINPKTGEVVQEIDMSGLLTKDEQKSSDVLNGIAFDEESKKIYVTGKWWPKLFEVTFLPKQ